MKLPELPPASPRSFGYGGYEMLKYSRACANAALKAAAAELERKFGSEISAAHCARSNPRTEGET